MHSKLTKEQAHMHVSVMKEQARMHFQPESYMPDTLLVTPNHDYSGHISTGKERSPGHQQGCSHERMHHIKSKTSDRQACQALKAVPER